MDAFNFDENYDQDYGANDNNKRKQGGNMFSSLMENNQNKGPGINDFPDFEDNGNGTPWDEEVWGQDNKTAANNPFWGTGGGGGQGNYGLGGGMGGFDLAALRGATKPAEKVNKPFHMDSMSLSYYDKDEGNNKPQDYVGVDVLNHADSPRDVSLSRQQSSNQVGAGNQGNQNNSMHYAPAQEEVVQKIERDPWHQSHQPSTFSQPIKEETAEELKQEEEDHWQNQQRKQGQGDGWGRQRTQEVDQWGQHGQNEAQTPQYGYNQQGYPDQNGGQHNQQHYEQQQHYDQQHHDQQHYGQNYDQQHYDQQHQQHQDPHLGDPNWHRQDSRNQFDQGNGNQRGNYARGDSRTNMEQSQATEFDKFDFSDSRQQKQDQGNQLKPQKSMSNQQQNMSQFTENMDRSEWIDPVKPQRQASFDNNNSRGNNERSMDYGDNLGIQRQKTKEANSSSRTNVLGSWDEQDNKPKQPAKQEESFPQRQEQKDPVKKPSFLTLEPVKERETPNSDARKSGNSPFNSPYSDDKAFLNKNNYDRTSTDHSPPRESHFHRSVTTNPRLQNNNQQRSDENTKPSGQPPSLNSLRLEPKGIQKAQKPKPPTSLHEVQTENVDMEPRMVSMQTQSPKREPKSNAIGNPRALGDSGDVLYIKCSLHEGQFIERICTHPKYGKKKLICWECGMDDSKEIQKYRHSLVPISQYALQNLEEYAHREGPEVPEELQKSLGKLESTREVFNQDILTNAKDLKRSLEFMKRQMLDKFEEISQAIDDMTHQKVGKFDINRNFFRHTLDTYYPDTSKQKVPGHLLYDNLRSLETETEFETFIKSLKPEVDPTAPEIKSYLRVLSHKIDTQELKLPNRDNFTNVHTKNLKVLQLQEQIMTNLDGIKGSLLELVNSSYNVDDITKTRMVTPKSLTQDSLATMAPLNKVSRELLRYRIQYEKKLSVPDSKSITCLTNIDNEIIAVGGLDKTITFWRIATSEILATIVGHDDAISGLYTYQVCMSDLKNRVPQTNNFNEDAVTLLVSTGGKFDNAIIFWDISWMHEYIRGRITTKQPIKPIRRLEGHESGITAVLPMIDGVTLISGAYDGKITVWNVLKSKVIGEIQHHTSAVSSLRLLRCNERYASASWDKTICIWRIFYKDLYDPDTGIHSDRRLFEGFEMEKIIDPSFRVMCLNASLVKKNWLVFGGSINRLIVWDVDEGRLVKEFECENNNLTDVVLIEDEQKEKMILFGVCNDDDVVRAWDTDYRETDGLIREAYNLKNRKKLYVNKSSISGSMLQIVQDGRFRLATANCADNKDLVSMWDVHLGL